jgi:cytochrome c biogenesis protein CcdA
VTGCHTGDEVVARPPAPVSATWLGLPLPALALAGGLAVVGVVASAVVAINPFDAAAFGGLTVPVVLGAGVLDGLNPCAFALLVLFATYTLAMVNRVTTAGSATAVARNQLLGAGSIYVGAVVVTYFLIGLGLFSFLGWMGQDHFATRIAAVLALLMGLWMMKDVFFPNVGPTLAAPRASHGWMTSAMERGGLGGMLLAGVLVGLCTVPCSGAIYLGIVALLNVSGGGPTGLALLALYNLAFIVPLIVLLAVVSNRRVLGSLGRWNRANSPWVKTGLALIVIAMSLGLLVTL